jgi:hypothetical protein
VRATLTAVAATRVVAVPRGRQSSGPRKGPLPLTVPAVELP